MAKDHVDYYYVKWRAYATIGGESIDITGFSLRYDLNQIPTAEFSPTVGVEPNSQTEARAVDALLAAEPYTPVEIFVKGETQMDGPQGAQAPGFPYNEFVKVFSGYYQGIGYRSSRSPAGGSVKLSGTAAHWLTGLTGTSSKNKVTAVKGAGGFAEVANIGDGPGLFDVKSLITAGPGSAEADLWVEFTKPFFYELTKNPDVWGASDNTSALEALGKMDNELVFTGDADNSLVISTELAGNVPDEMLVRFYTEGIAYHLFKRWQQSNLWAALQAIAGAFGFMIVPLIDTATCAPIFGALGGDPFVTIGTNEYSDCYINAVTPALITKLVLTGKIAGASSPYSPTSIISAVLGIASSEDAWVGPAAPVRGITIREDAPAWLESNATIGRLTRFSLGGAGGIIPDAVNPDSNPQNPDYDYQEKYNNYLLSDLGDRVAQTRLFNLMLRDRTGWISGRFRLDVCPGSTVKVQVIDDKFSQFNDNPKYVYGLVSGVQIDMEADAGGGTGRAATSFDLQYVRSANEHEGAGGYMTAEEHPVYETKFVGAKLWSD